MRAYQFVTLAFVSTLLLSCDWRSGGGFAQNRSLTGESRGAARTVTDLPTQGIETTEELEKLIDQIKALPADEQKRVLAALRLDARIIGGTPMQIANHPWQVALVRGQSPRRDHFCGGSLIAPDIVVTAAHCIDSDIVDNDPTRVDVLAGTSQIDQGGQRIEVRTVAVHPNWQRRTRDYDVAVLRLTEPATVGRHLSLETQEIDTLPKEGTWVTGWGATRENGWGSNTLLGVEVPVVRNSECNAPEIYDAGSPTGCCAPVCARVGSTPAKMTVADP
jgi:hypothetical protein